MTAYQDVPLFGAAHDLTGEPRPGRARATDPETSHTAAAAITVRAGTHRFLLLDAFDAAACALMDGLTDEQAAQAAGLTAAEYAKRCSELRDAGLIEPTGATRPGSAGVPRIVSRITDRGYAALRDAQADAAARAVTP